MKYLFLGEIFNMMFYCWDKDPEERPSFSQLVKVMKASNFFSSWEPTNWNNLSRVFLFAGPGGLADKGNRLHRPEPVS